MRLLAIATVAGALALVASPAGASGTTAVGATKVMPLTVYLVHDMHVAPVRRVVVTNGAPARAALSALLRGPTAGERSRGYSTAIPAGTALRSVAVAGGLATVDVSRRFATGGGSASMLLRVAQVVFTTTQFAGADRVAFKLDGTLIRSVGGEGVVTLPPVTRHTFEPQAPPILIEKPLAGDRVSRSFMVSGTANVYEARLVVELQTTSGTILVRRHVSATSGSGTRGTFSAIVVLPTGLRQAVAVVVVYTRSAKDGRPIDVGRIPVRLLRR